MFKKLDILILRSYIGPFIVTFFITLFVFVMQFFWLYMDELIGKGLSTWMIIQLLVYMSTTMVPMALPLGILLASIMTFGNLGENFELVAIKSSGISLLRFMRPLLVFIIFIGGVAFLFNNYVIPFANLKAYSLLYDLRNSKPSFNLREGVFNTDIENYAIRIGKKDPDGQTIRNIIIYDHTAKNGNEKVTIAEEGALIPSKDNQFLIFRLKNGWRYEENVNWDHGKKREQRRMHFKKWDKVFDISAFRVNRTNEDLFKNAYQMMDVQQLTEGIDSFKRYQAALPNTLAQTLNPYMTIASDKDNEALVDKIQKSKAQPAAYDSTFLQLINDTLRKDVVKQAFSQMRNARSLIGINANQYSMKEQNNETFTVEWHRKFTLSFACILLFLIGAPLGAIIRKGGLGMPLLIAVGFFVVFHIISITGEKLARTGSVDVWMGMWMATGMLLPFAFVLIYQARNDSQILTKEWYLRGWNKIRTLFKAKK